MFDWELRDPWFLSLALLAPMVYYLLAKRSPASVTYSSLMVLGQTPRSMRTRLANMPALLLASAVLAMSVALAGPRTPDAETRVRREGIAVVMVVDRSGSMQARDLVKDNTEIDRLDVVKERFEQFVLGNEAQRSSDVGRGRSDDVIGLVAFARYADSLCPLTLDHGNLINIVHDLQIVTDRNEDGTALGEGLALAVERLRRHPTQSKVAIVLTDGVNNAGDINPIQAAELARTEGVKVYCIGAGTRGLAPVPVRDPFTRKIFLQPAQVEIDENTLQAIAQQTGGRYFRATDRKALAEIYDQIDRLERTEVTELRYLQYQEWYRALVIVALAMIGASELLAGSFLRRLP